MLVMQRQRYSNIWNQVAWGEGGGRWGLNPRLFLKELYPLQPQVTWKKLALT
jgi:hypothetical protein